MLEGSAHLPGMVASITTIPATAGPIKTASLDGLDSLLSIVQMPAGIPVATVAINGSKNAGILACQILALKYKKIAARIEKYRKDLRNSVIQKARAVKNQSSDEVCLWLISCRVQDAQIDLFFLSYLVIHSRTMHLRATI